MQVLTLLKMVKAHHHTREFNVSTTKKLCCHTLIHKINLVSVWSDGETRHLLDLYANYMSEIGPMKKFKNKKDMWVKIASEVSEKTAKQCEERYKTVLRRKKVAIDNNHASGSKRKHIDFEDELTKICQMDDSIEPEIQISSQKCVKAEKSENQKFKNPKLKKKTVQETLLEIADKKEEARERRHKERMEAAHKMQSILDKLLDDREK